MPPKPVSASRGDSGDGSRRRSSSGGIRPEHGADLLQLAAHRPGQLLQSVLLLAQELGEPSEVGAPGIDRALDLLPAPLDVTGRLGLGLGDDPRGHPLGPVDDLVDSLRGLVDDPLQLRPGPGSGVRAGGAEGLAAACSGPISGSVVCSARLKMATSP